MILNNVFETEILLPPDDTPAGNTTVINFIKVIESYSKNWVNAFSTWSFSKFFWCSKIQIKDKYPLENVKF